MRPTAAEFCHSPVSTLHMRLNCMMNMSLSHGFRHISPLPLRPQVGARPGRLLAQQVALGLWHQEYYCSVGGITALLCERVEVIL